MVELVHPLMVIALLATLLVGYPIAFSLAAIAGAFGAAGVIAGRFDAVFLQAMVFRVQGVFNNDNLLAIPMLIFMGVLLERTKIAEDMFLEFVRILGRLPGSIGCAAVLIGALLSSLTGFVSASVTAIALITMPPLLRAGYDARLASGIVAASGTLAQVIPPSLVLIVLAEQMETSLQEVYKAAAVPSIMLVGGYLIYVAIAAPRPPGAAGFSGAISDTLPSWRSTLQRLGTPITLIAFVLAAISFGVATPSEGGAIGVLGTLGLAIAQRRLSFSRLKDAMDFTGLLCAAIIFLLLGASFFTLVFRGWNGHAWIEAILSHLPSGTTGFVIMVNVAVFAAGFVLDFFEIALIVLPLIAPAAQRMGIDMVWLTVLLAVNLQLSFMHPPFGIALFNVRSVAPRSVATSAIYWGAIPFLVIQLAVLVMLIVHPPLVRLFESPKGAPSDLPIFIPPPPPHELKL